MAVSDRLSGAVAYTQRQVDLIVPPQHRQQALERTYAFAAQRPILFSFLVSQTIFSFFPLLLFVIFSFSTIAFALVSALLFSLFWIGVALLFLVPALLVTSGVGLLVWAWAVASFLVARWVYNVVPVNVRGGVEVEPLTNGKSGNVRLYRDEKGVKVENNLSDAAPAYN